MEKYLFVATIYQDINHCPGPVTGSVEIVPVHGSAPYLYSLNGGGFQTSNIYKNLSEGTYSLVVKDASGCSYSTVISISTTNLVSTKVTNTTCGKRSGSILVTPAFGRPPYTYSLNGGVNQTANIFNNLAEGAYDIVIKDSTSCSYKFSATVGADNFLTANLDIIKPDCLGNANGSVVVHPSSGNAPYQFALDSNPFTSDSIFNNLSARDYILHVKDSLGCIKDIVITLSQPNLFEISGITTYASTCLSSDGIIFVKANGGTTPYMYSIDSAKTFSLSNTFTAGAGAHPIVVRDAKGCISNGVAIVDAKDNKIKVDVGPDKTICYGSSINLSSTTNLKATSFSWTPALGLNDPTSANPIATPLDTTTYILTAKTLVCEGSDTITINVLPKPIANAGKDTTICNKTYAILKGSATKISGGVTYLWLPSAGLDSPTSSTTIARPTTTGAHNYRLQVSDTYGCNFKVYDDVKVTMNETLAASAGNDTVASIGMPHQLLGSGGIDYLWSPSNVLDDPLAQNPIASLQNDTRFNVVVKDTLGCVGTSTVLVKVYKGVTYYIPNAFTPNGDGINDVFRAIAPGIQTNYFRIFNRWGKLMFQTNNTSKGWNGIHLGVPQPSAVYVWIIKGLDLSGKIVELKGTVTLIR
ncbi:MAG: gliding motility-associated C-terminal domain-containing protein [Chitinophagaceae bacterium]